MRKHETRNKLAKKKERSKVARKKDGNKLAGEKERRKKSIFLGNFYFSKSCFMKTGRQTRQEDRQFIDFSMRLKKNSSSCY